MMTELIAAMKQVLANTFQMYFAAHACHWNVTGMYFHSLHGFFGMIYEALWQSIDPIAEHIRTLKILAPNSIGQLVENFQVSEFTSYPDAQEMMTGLLGMNSVTVTSLRNAQQLAEREGLVELSNFLEDRLDEHAKWEWQLRSHLGMI